LRIILTEEKIFSAKDAIEIIFPNKKTQAAAHLFIQFLKDKDGKATKNAVSDFADKLQSGTLIHNNIPFKYSRRNFYVTLTRTLVSLGFIQRNVPVWDDGGKKTNYVYVRNIFDIPRKPPSVGFWRLAYYICRKWNLLFENSDKDELNIES